MIVKLPLRLRMLVHEHGSDGVFPSVRCPRTNRSIDALTCMGCARMRSVEWDRESGGVIECRIDAAAPCSDADVDRRADLAEAAARRPLHEVMTAVTYCVPGSTPVRRARSLMLARDLPGVPVVDDDMKLRGVVTRADVLGSAPCARVEEVMREAVHALPENAPIAYAIAMMAFEDVPLVAVTAEDGELVGVWTATAALRWTAGRMGWRGS